MSKVEMGGNLQQDISGSEQERQKPGLELSHGEELDGVVEATSNLAEKVKRDEKVTGEDVLKLDEALGKVKIDFYGERMTIDEINRIPDVKNNIDIWERIKNGPMPELKEVASMTFVMPEILSDFLNWAKDISKRREITLDLSGLETLTPELANIIARSPNCIKLNGLKFVSDKVLSILFDVEGILELEGLEDLSDEAMRLLPDNFFRTGLRFSEKVEIKIQDYIDKNK